MKKILAFLLMAVMLISLIACDTTPSESLPSESTPATDVSDETSTEVSEEFKYEYPAIDLEKDDIIFVVPNSQYSYYESFEIFAAELKDEVINDAVFNRNAIVESKLNCYILEDKQFAIHEIVKTNFNSGIDDYDVYMPMMNDSITLAADGYLADLTTLEGINLDGEWWDQRANKDLTLNGKLYFSTGDISILDNECTMVMFFNKTLISQNDLENPYDLVKSHKWTIDKVYEMSKEFTADNGDGKWNNQDKYGLHVAINAPHSFFFGGGGRMSENDGENITITLGNEAFTNMIDDIMEISLSTSVVTNNHAGCTTFENICDMFTNNQIIFTTFALTDMRQFRNAKNFDFGILPYPHYSEDQTEYNCLISTSLVPGVCFLDGFETTDNAAIVVDAMAYESMETLTDAYYDKTLTLRDLRDEESGEMLDIIFSSRVYDIGYICNWGGMGKIFEDMYSSKQNNFTSKFDGMKTAIDSAMEDTMMRFKD